MSNATLVRNTSSFTSGAARFGSLGLASGVYTTGTADSFLATEGSTLGTGTVEGWVKLPSTSGLRVFLGHDTWFWIGVDNTGKLAARYGQSDVVLNANVVITDDVFHHVALVFNAGSASLYLDGTRVATSASTPATGTATVKATLIGGFGTYSGFDWQGSIDEVRISNVARYTGTTYTVPASAFNPDSGTVALYHLEGDGTDAAGSGDTTAPSVPGTPTATAGNATASVAFTSSTDDVAVTGYRVYSSADSYTAAVASGSSSPITVSGLSNGTAYTFRVAARDAAGNESAKSAASNSVAPASGETILPNDPNIVYSPYTWAVTSSAAKTINAGAYFRTLIQGNPTAIALGFDLAGVGSPLPQITVLVDGIARFSQAVATTVTVPLPSGQTWTSHLVEVVVKSTTETQPRWSTQATAVKFTGVTTTPGTCTTSPIQPAGLRGLVYGDSITEGVRTLNSTATDDTDRNDALLSWSYRLRSELGAEVGVVGFGASGLLAPGSGGVPPLPTSYNLLWAGQARVLTPAPDFIVLMEGVNDGSSSTIAAATTVLNGLLSATPASSVIVVLRPLNGTAQAGNLQAAVAGCASPARVRYVDTTSWLPGSSSSDGLHPYGHAHLTSVAPRAAAAVRAALRQGARYIRRSDGTAKLLTALRR